MKKLLFLSCLILAGCGERPVGLSNEEIVTTTKYCENNGLDAQLYGSEWVILEVKCYPRKHSG